MLERWLANTKDAGEDEQTGSRCGICRGATIDAHPLCVGTGGAGFAGGILSVGKFKNMYFNDVLEHHADYAVG